MKSYLIHIIKVQIRSITHIFYAMRMKIYMYMYIHLHETKYFIGKEGLQYIIHGLKMSNIRICAPHLYTLQFKVHILTGFKYVSVPLVCQQITYHNGSDFFYLADNNNYIRPNNKQYICAKLIQII